METPLPEFAKTMLAMGNKTNVKDIIIKRIDATSANAFIRANHYSGKVVPNSQLHFGAFLNNRLHGVMSFGPSTMKRLMIGLVFGTKWNEFIELNRMAFDNYLPKNSESRSIAIALRLIKKFCPQIKWVLSFADGCQCGDGTIYRASGFVLTQIKKNIGLRIDEEGNVYSRVSITAHKPNEIKSFYAMKALDGYQLRYIYFIDRESLKNLTVPIIPFEKIKEIGAAMYKGKKICGTN